MNEARRVFYSLLQSLNNRYFLFSMSVCIRPLPLLDRLCDSSFIVSGSEQICLTSWLSQRIVDTIRYDTIAIFVTLCIHYECLERGYRCILLPVAFNQVALFSLPPPTDARGARRVFPSKASAKARAAYATVQHI